jgi:hypothetical protein
VEWVDGRVKGVDLGRRKKVVACYRSRDVDPKSGVAANFRFACSFCTSQGLGSSSEMKKRITILLVFFGQERERVCVCYLNQENSIDGGSLLFLAVFLFFSFHCLLSLCLGSNCLLFVTREEWRSLMKHAFP